MNLKKSKVETENIPTNNITELNVLICAGSKSVCDKIDVPLRNTNRNSKPGRESRLEIQLKKIRQQKRRYKGREKQGNMLE